jgi:hypothetical protein
VTGGAIKCWGDNSTGQLGTGSITPSSSPVPVTGLASGVQAIATGYQHTCAIANGVLQCWGLNINGQVASDPDTLQSTVPLPIAGLICGLVHGDFRCFGGCADGSVEQVFENGMVGCAGAVSFANRGALCAPGYQPATSTQWTAHRGAAAPTHDYWTNDLLRYNGTGPSACFVSTTVGTDCGATMPMRVCTAAGTDAEGNSCNWTHCGINTNTPDQFFGGCFGNTTAGMLCVPVP